VETMRPSRSPPALELGFPQYGLAPLSDALCIDELLFRPPLLVVRHLEATNQGACLGQWKCCLTVSNLVLIPSPIVPPKTCSSTACRRAAFICKQVTALSQPILFSSVHSHVGVRRISSENQSVRVFMREACNESLPAPVSAVKGIFPRKN
jgi:hypothetical protein